MRCLYFYITIYRYIKLYMRTKGKRILNTNFEVLQAVPIDGRMLVTGYTDITGFTTSDKPYNGMLVSNEGLDNISKAGLYFLSNKNILSGVSSWDKFVFNKDLNGYVTTGITVNLTGNQSIDGNKTFLQQTIFLSGLISPAFQAQDGSKLTSLIPDGLNISNPDGIADYTYNSIKFSNPFTTAHTLTVTIPELSGISTITYPNASGTIALTNDLFGKYLPITGGTVTGNTTIIGSTVSDAFVTSEISGGTTYTTRITPFGMKFTINNTYSGSLTYNSFSTGRTWILPDKDGTVAMLSDISGSSFNSDNYYTSGQTDSKFLALTGGTLTGDETIEGKLKFLDNGNTVEIYYDDLTSKVIFDTNTSDFQIEGSVIGYNFISSNPNDTFNYSNLDNNKLIFQNSGYTNFLSYASLTTGRTWVLPDKDGTVAMLSDISGSTFNPNEYVTTGGTLQQILGDKLFSGEVIFGDGLITSSEGLKFPDDPFGGSGDIGGIKLLNKGGEGQTLEIYVGNENDDTINISVPHGGTGFTVNGFPVYHTGNFSINNYVTTGTTQTVAGDKTFSNDIFVNTIVRVGKGGGNLVTNTVLGDSTLLSNTTGAGNTAIGVHALSGNTTGSTNVAVGIYTLNKNIGGNNNIAVGAYAMSGDTNGYESIGIGSFVLENNTTGYRNVGIGMKSLISNTTGVQNIAVGSHSMTGNTTGSNNIGIGDSALCKNTSGLYNLAIGYESIYKNTTGYNNIGIGNLALHENTGFYNLAIGHETLYNNTSGYNNIGIGNLALNANTNGFGNIAIGKDSLISNTVGSNNIVVGSGLVELTTGSGNTSIGYMHSGLTVGSKNTFIGGKIFLSASESGLTNNIILTDGDGNRRLSIDSSGNATFQGSVSASGGFFDTSDINLKNIVENNFDVSKIKTISYTWKDNRDSNIHIGYSAQEVEKYLPSAVMTDKKGEKSVRYMEVLVAKIAQLEKEILNIKQK